VLSHWLQVELEALVHWLAAQLATGAQDAQVMSAVAVQAAV
jgi:hypothetical protein